MISVTNIGLPLSCTKNTAPLKKITVKSTQLPYMHSELRQNMYKRNMLDNKAKKWNTDKAHEA